MDCETLFKADWVGEGGVDGKGGMNRVGGEVIRMLLTLKMMSC